MGMSQDKSIAEPTLLNVCRDSFEVPAETQAVLLVIVDLLELIRKTSTLDSLFLVRAIRTVFIQEPLTDN
jgi:hypothetical protein